MNIDVKKLPKNLIEIIAELRPEEMEPFNNEALAELARNIQVPGFRPGKAPLEMVRPQIDEIKILEKAAELAVNKKYPEILVKENLNPAGPPKVDVQKLAPGNPLVFKLTIPLVPKVTLGNWKKIKVKRKKIEPDQKEIEKTLETLQESRRKEHLVNRPAKSGDRVDIDMNLSLDKVPLENGQVKNLTVILGKDYYVPGLSSNLEGLKKGREKEFSLHFPETHYDKKLAGRKVDFKVKINEVYQIDLPPLDDKFAKNLGFENLVNLKDHLKKSLEAQAKNKEEERVEIEILKELVARSHFEEIPDILVSHELDKMLAELAQNLEAQNLKFEDYLISIKKTEEDLRKGLVSQAEERIKTALVIREIAREEKIEVQEEEVKSQLDKISELYKDKKEILEKFTSEAGQSYLKNMLINRKVVELLKKQIL